MNRLSREFGNPIGLHLSRCQARATANGKQHYGNDEPLAEFPVHAFPHMMKRADALLDHLVGTKPNRCGYGKTERLGGLSVQGHYEFDRQLNG